MNGKASATRSDVGKCEAGRAHVANTIARPAPGTSIRSGAGIKCQCFQITISSRADSIFSIPGSTNEQPY